MSATEHVELPIGGMSCASCANRVERRLNGLEGVTATVNYATERATVDFDPAVASPEQLVRAVEEAGYEATLPAPDESDALRRRLVVSAALALPVLLGDHLAHCVAESIESGQGGDAKVKEAAQAVQRLLRA